MLQMKSWLYGNWPGLAVGGLLFGAIGYFAGRGFPVFNYEEWGTVSAVVGTFAAIIAGLIGAITIFSLKRQVTLQEEFLKDGRNERAHKNLILQRHHAKTISSIIEEISPEYVFSDPNRLSRSDTARAHKNIRIALKELEERFVDFASCTPEGTLNGIRIDDYWLINRLLQRTLELIQSAQSDLENLTERFLAEIEEEKDPTTKELNIKMAKEGSVQFLHKYFKTDLNELGSFLENIKRSKTWLTKFLHSGISNESLAAHLKISESKTIK